MKLASLRHGRDGRLAVVDRELQRAIVVPEIAETLQSALDNWADTEPQLMDIYNKLNQGRCQSSPFSPAEVAAPLPRSFQWLDGSAFLSHVERVRKARGADLPPGLLEDPLMYQGGSDTFLGPLDPVYAETEQWGIDFEAEVAVFTDFVDMGISPDDAGAHIKLVTLVNDVSLRNLIPAELSKGFGFINGKPSSAFAPVAVTTDELESAWQGGKLHLPLSVFWNDDLFGHANAGTDMQFSFGQLISHAAKTRHLGAGTIIGSGTVSNKNSKGYSCIVEKRVVEIVENGTASTDYMRFGDQVKIEMIGAHGNSIFGAIHQKVKKWP